MATRFYFTNLSGNIANSAMTGFSPGWFTTGQGGKYNLQTTSGDSARIAGTTCDINATANRPCLDRIYISRPLASGTITGYTSGQLMVREFVTNDDVNQVYSSLYVIDKNGNLRGRLLNTANYGTTLELINNASMRNCMYMSGTGSVITTSVTADYGDRLVLEIGYNCTAGGTSPQGAATWGNQGLALPHDNSSTTSDGIGWFDLSTNVNFIISSDVQGVASISKTFQSNQNGTAKIQTSKEQSQQGVARIANTYSQNQQGVADIKNTLSFNQQGVARIQNSYSRNQQGLANVLASATTQNQQISGLGRVFNSGNNVDPYFQTSSGWYQGRIALDGSYVLEMDQFAVFQPSGGLQSGYWILNYTGTNSGHKVFAETEGNDTYWAILQTPTGTELGDKYKLLKATDNTYHKITVEYDGGYRLDVNQDNTNDKFISGLSRITNTYGSNNQGTANIYNSGKSWTLQSTNSGWYYIAATYETNQYELFVHQYQDPSGSEPYWILRNNTTGSGHKVGLYTDELDSTYFDVAQTPSGNFGEPYRLVWANDGTLHKIYVTYEDPNYVLELDQRSTSDKFIQGLASISAAAVTNQYNQTGRARVTNTYNSYIQGVSRITNTYNSWITGQARVTNTYGYNQNGIARITNTYNSNQQGIARITNNYSRNQQGLARITNSYSSSINGLSRITNSYSQNQQGTSRITNTYNNFINGVARITFSYSKNQQGVSRITNSYSNNQTGKASVLNSVYNYQQGIATISLGSVQKNQQGLCRITNTYYSSLNGTANIYNPDKSWTLQSTNSGWYYFSAFSGENGYDLNIHQYQDPSGSEPYWILRNNTTGSGYKVGLYTNELSETQFDVAQTPSGNFGEPYRLIWANDGTQHKVYVFDDQGSVTLEIDQRATIDKSIDGISCVYNSGKSSLLQSTTSGWHFFYIAYDGNSYSLKLNQAILPNYSGDPYWILNNTVNGSGYHVALKTDINDLTTFDVDQTPTGFQGENYKLVWANDDTLHKVYLTEDVDNLEVLVVNQDATNDSFIRGVSNILASSGTQPQYNISGKCRVTNTYNSNINGLARLTNTYSQNQQGIARITNTYSRNQQGISRIQNTYNSNQQGISRIQNNYTSNQQGIVRITNTYSRNQQGVARITNSYTSNQQGVARVQNTYSANQNGTARIANTYNSNINGVSRITNSYSSNQNGVARIANTYSKNQQGVASILVQGQNAQNQQGKANIRNSVSSNQQGVADIKNTLSSNQQGIARITVSIDKNQQGVARITATAERSQSGVGNIRNTQSSNMQGVADIRNSLSRNQQGVARISSSNGSNQQGVARITATTERNQNGVANIRNSQSTYIQGVADIRASYSSNEQGVSRIQNSYQSNLNGVANVRNNISQNNQGVARITNSSTSNTSGVARIQISTQNNQQGVARIAISAQQANTNGKANIRNSYSSNQSGTSNIRASVSRNQQGVAKIESFSSSAHQSGKSRILGTLSNIYKTVKMNSGQSRIVLRGGRRTPIT